MTSVLQGPKLHHRLVVPGLVAMHALSVFSQHHALRLQAKCREIVLVDVVYTASFNMCPCCPELHVWQIVTLQ